MVRPKEQEQTRLESEVGRGVLAGDAPLPPYTVEDLNATRLNKKRTHTINVPQPNGKVQLKPFTFMPGKGLAMTQEIALLFLDIDPAFRVRNSLGQIVRPRAHGGSGDRMVKIKHNEMVVPIQAVIKAYLWETARMLPGGKEKFPDSGKGMDHKREALEEFIIAGGTVQEDEDDATNLDTVAA